MKPVYHCQNCGYQITKLNDIQLDQCARCRLSCSAERDFLRDIKEAETSKDLKEAIVEYADSLGWRFEPKGPFDS